MPKVGPHCAWRASRAACQWQRWVCDFLPHLRTSSCGGCAKKSDAPASFRFFAFFSLIDCIFITSLASFRFNLAPIYTSIQINQQALLEGGANAAHVLRDGRSALFVAAASGCAGIVELLLDAIPTAQPKKKKDGASTPTSTIVSTTSSSDVNEDDYDTDDDDEGNAGGSGARKLKSLIDGANSDGETPLFVSAANGHARVLETLLEHGARVDYAPKALSMTPLLVASAQGERGFVLIWCFVYEK